MRRISYTQLKLNLRCPWHYGLRYLEHWVPKIPEASEALAVGKEMHESLSKAYRSGILQIDGYENEDSSTLSKWYGSQLDVDCYEHQILATEWPFQVAVQTPKGTRSNYLLRGWIDLISHHLATGDIWIWDHKITKSPRTTIASGFQLRIYAWALHQMGLDVGTLVLNQLVRTKSPKLVRLPYPYSAVESAAMASQVYAMASALPSPSTERWELPKHVSRDCEWDCGFKEVCIADTAGFDADEVLGYYFQQAERPPEKKYHTRVPVEWRRLSGVPD